MIEIVAGPNGSGKTTFAESYFEKTKGESTLSGRTWLLILQEAIQSGYQIKIYFIYLNSIQKNLSRIQKRVSLGGHPIPRESVHRRHPRCFDNFWNLYRPLCSEWYIFDNSGHKPKLLQESASYSSLPEKEQQRFLNLFLKGRVDDRKKK